MTTSIRAIAHHLPPEADAAGARRPIASDPGGPSDLALPAAHRALERVGLSPADLEFIVFATMTPDVTFPGSACYLQDKLGCSTIGALDIRGQCTGFLMGLMVADAFVASGTYQHVALATAEVHSSGLDYDSDAGRHIAALYGDGAAVTLVGPGESGLESVICHSDGREHQRFWCEYPASRQHPVRIAMENFREGRHFPHVDVDAVAAFGRNALPEVVRETLDRASATPDGVDCFILSHILPDVAEAAADSLGLPSDRWVNAAVAHGHLTAATLPVALEEARASGRIAPGARVCLAACGAGYTWGAAVLRV